ncbi:MAG: hypothetical protein KGO50_01640 [Myxococcales bacterium]|nr:hypothetical protein [Myxococcales bacterium]
MNEYQYTSTAWLVWTQLRYFVVCLVLGISGGALAGEFSFRLVYWLAPELSEPWFDVWHWVIFMPFGFSICLSSLYLVIRCFPQLMTEQTLTEGELRRRYRRYMRYRNR